MRCFIAIDIDRQTTLALSRLIGELREYRWDVRWVDIRNLHLTFHFFPDVREEGISMLKQIVIDTAQKISAFEVLWKGIGYFPSTANPRVIWIGTESVKEELTALHTGLEARLKAGGFPLEKRPFRPHLTIGRWRSCSCDKKPGELAEKYAQARWGSTFVNELLLIRSTLTPAGPVYENIAAGAMSVKTEK